MIRQAQTADTRAILDIYNDAILTTTSVYDYKPHTLEDRISWLEKKASDGYPVIVFEENNSVIGFASYGPFRAWPAYKYTIEHSVYVHKDHRGKGVGRQLMNELIQVANSKVYAIMVAAIDAGNKASITMHKKLGFTKCGTIKKAGFKFGKWLDLTFYEYELRGPEAPKDG